MVNNEKMIVGRVSRLRKVRLEIIKEIIIVGRVKVAESEGTTVK